MTAAERDGIRLIAVVMLSGPGTGVCRYESPLTMDSGILKSLRCREENFLCRRSDGSDLTETSVDIEDGVFRTYTYNDYTVGTVTVSTGRTRCS